MPQKAAHENAAAKAAKLRPAAASAQLNARAERGTKIMHVCTQYLVDLLPDRYII